MALIAVKVVAVTEKVLDPVLMFLSEIEIDLFKNSCTCNVLYFKNI